MNWRKGWHKSKRLIWFTKVPGSPILGCAKKFNIFYKLLISFTLQKTFLKKRLDQYAKILTMPEQKIIISMILET